MSDRAITNGKIGSISDTITLKDIPRRPTIYENAHGTGLAYCSAPDTTRYADAMERRIAKSEARVIALERALREIKEVVHRRQLPITHQIWDIADAALGDH